MCIYIHIYTCLHYSHYRTINVMMRYMILQLYEEYGTIILVGTEVPTGPAEGLCRVANTLAEQRGASPILTTLLHSLQNYQSFAEEANSALALNNMKKEMPHKGPTTQNRSCAS